MSPEAPRPPPRIHPDNYSTRQPDATKKNKVFSHTSELNNGFSRHTHATEAQHHSIETTSADGKTLLGHETLGFGPTAQLFNYFKMEQKESSESHRSINLTKCWLALLFQFQIRFQVYVRVSN